MITARSIHVGLNGVDRSSYRGWAGRLRACEHDARAMQTLCVAGGLTPSLLLTAAATRAAVLAAFERAAAELRSGDLLVVTYSGHGASFAEAAGEEADGRDEAWCLYDGYLLDDEIHAALTRFAGGVRILVVSDSCFSGTVTRVDDGADTRGGPRPRLRDGSGSDDLGRRFPPDLARSVYEARRSTYDERKRSVADAQARSPAASVVLLAACQDNQTATESGDQGRFTAELLAVWDHGAFAGDHAQFVAAICPRMPAGQVPSLYMTGVRSPAFEASRPFTP